MDIKFTPEAWEDYEWLLGNSNKKLLQKTPELIKSISRTPFEGIGKPEALKKNLQGYWSRMISQEHRLVYRVENDTMIIVSCRYHYKDITLAVIE